MEYWEFLIQKENDRSWQSLKSAEVELPQGRYRLVVRSNRADTDIDIRIIHNSIYENPPKRRLQKRSRRINSEGLMVLIPFTDLTPGIWEFRCLPDLFEDLMGEPWQKNLKLKVLPPETQSDSAKLGKQEIGEPGRIGDLTISHQSKIPVSGVKSTTPDPYPLRLTLKQEAFMARAGQSITLAGYLELPNPENQDNEAKIALTGEMRIRLRDPQSGEVLAQRQQQLITQEIPFTFACNIHIPVHSKTHLLLGEVTIYDVPEVPNDSPLVLATRSFSITADLDDLLSAIADNFHETEALEVSSNQSKSAALDLAAYNQATTPQNLNFPVFQPGGKQILPPQIYQHDLIRNPIKKVELPSFGNFGTPEPEPELATSSTSETSELETESIVEDIISESFTEATENSDQISTDEDENAAEIDPSIDFAFQSLKLEERFWSRLNAIASDAELVTELGSDPLFEDIEEESETPAAIYTGPDAELAAMEFVVEEEQPTTPTRKSENSLSSLGESSEEETEAEILPTPELDVPEGELTAGQQIRVRVRVPLRQPRLGVKFWVVDLQTRSLVEGPNWLADFYPDAWGNLETSFQMTVPFGCLEIRFEAISSDISTKQESRKAQINRSVVPPDLPQFSEDDLTTL
ncbi:hypothetical protein NIES2119_10750 [[Phormidium ambiguum] IAM M-71]|uniref:Uncharacterized protein n=1 Tax=[Phormidium ambiguum] IAM M-71 TaxID=454136 RepID=A0A1U7ILJ3_9CYAN|nr:hypothetical protein [Phormidium ambiguum]OKH38039.1 hypothetical protein NIES2119_10750 [Phormidium ambiguum IAM M-71]